MSEDLIGNIKRHLDAEEQTNKLLQLHSDFYLKVAAHVHNLKRTISPSNSELSNRLITKQIKMISEMIGKLLNLRIEKSLSGSTIDELLPEERFVCSAADSFRIRKRNFIIAITNGQPSYLQLAQRKELERSVVIRFLKPMSEIVGIDLRKYGPFKPDDIAALPAANASILIANNEAIIIDLI